MLLLSPLLWFQGQQQEPLLHAAAPQHPNVLLVDNAAQVHGGRSLIEHSQPGMDTYGTDADNNFCLARVDFGHCVGERSRGWAEQLQRTAALQYRLIYKCMWFMHVVGAAPGPGRGGGTAQQQPGGDGGGTGGDAAGAPHSNAGG